MSLLTDLRLTPAVAEDRVSPWRLVSDTLPLLVPGAEVSDAVVVRGSVQVRGRMPRSGGWRYFLALLANEDDSLRILRGEHVVPSLQGVGLPPDDTYRVVRMGLSSAKYEVDGNFYSSPFASWIHAAPGAMAVWVAGVLLTAEQDWPVAHV